MANDASPGSSMDKSSSASADLRTAPKRKKGIFTRVWNGIFGARGEDFEKKLQYLSKEEASVHARMKRRSHSWRRMARNIVLLSVILEIVAVAYAILTTRSVDLNWKMRAARVLPMFVLPALSSAIYSTLSSFNRMFDRKDQKTLERLRAERQEKIDELKEKTNYYTTQQLIQRYDPDPAAKAAAATVLASKLGVDSGLKVYVGDESEGPKHDMSVGKSNDAQLVRPNELRNRKQNQASTINEGNVTNQQIIEDSPQPIGFDGHQVTGPDPKVVGHYKSQSGDGGWIARIAALLVGEDPTQCYALICGNCHMHNGLARKEDFPYICYYCPHCHALNAPQRSEGHDSSGSDSGKETSKIGYSDVITTTNSSEIKSALAIASQPTDVNEGSGKDQPSN